MKKLALALVCLVSVAFFASCNQPKGQPTIAVLQEEGFVKDGDIVNLGEEVNFGFVMATSPQSNSLLKSLIIKIDDEAPDTIDIQGTEYTYKGVITYNLSKDEIVGNSTIIATVYDAVGEFATTSIKLSINQPAQPLISRTFTWNRHGGDDGTGLAEFGLKWTRNLSKAIYAIIEPVEGATLYRFEPTVWDATTTDVEKAALFSEATPVDPQQWKEFNVTGATTQTFDVVLGTVYNGEYHLMHITKGTYYSFKATDATIEGEAK